MSKWSRRFRFEILLPRKFNDGQPVPDDLIGTTLMELRSHFGAVSFEPQTIQGTWLHEGHEYQDELVRVFVDVADEADAKEFFEGFKEQLKQRFQQLDIWITTYPIEVL
jgi:hypothetical protein